MRDMTDDSRTALLGTPIENLELSVRCYNRLKRAGIHTLGDLSESSERDLISLPHFGDRSLQEVISALERYDLKLSDA